MSRAKLLAFYLPQFHPVKENNEWWGEGFTEWTNAVAARPQFRGHYQPHLPKNLGFYDLRVAETRVQQADVAGKYGIHGFCYYHYWFAGQTIIGRPFDEVLASGVPNFPFCLCWANENWTRAWDGQERQVLVRQTYDEEDSLAHIEWLVKSFKDNRYIKVSGRPLLLIYRPDSIPDASTLLERWRRFAIEAGLKGIYICAVRHSAVSASEQELLALGYDAIVDFQPNREDFPKPEGLLQTLYRAMRTFMPNGAYQWLKIRASAVKRVNYRKMVAGLASKSWPDKYRRYPCVFPSWDNTARRKTPTVIQNDDPALYGRWLSEAIGKIRNYPEEERFVFVNAWNEWAEGCHLEPDMRFGFAFLEATREAIEVADKET